ncbi:unnamed protein product, partial [Amoebophrya sp. A25]|eukprot:GSA25T00020916001.1
MSANLILADEEAAPATGAEADRKQMLKEKVLRIQQKFEAIKQHMATTAGAGGPLKGSKSGATLTREQQYQVRELVAANLSKAEAMIGQCQAAVDQEGKEVDHGGTSNAIVDAAAPAPEAAGASEAQTVDGGTIKREVEKSSRPVTAPAAQGRSQQPPTRGRSRTAAPRNKKPGLMSSYTTGIKANKQATVKEVCILRHQAAVIQHQAEVIQEQAQLISQAVKNDQISETGGM